MSIMGEIINFLSSDLRTATPIMICGLGLVFSARSGVVNIGAEGMMLTGALMGVVGSYFFGNVWMGVLTAMVSALLMALVFAYFTIHVKADQTVVGIAINTLGLGITTTLSRVIFGLNTARPKIDSFGLLKVPLLSKIPILGSVLFNQTLPVYLILLFVPVANFVMFKTNLGLKIRSVGENPKACDTVGINVLRVRYGAILFSGLMAGFAGAFVSLGNLSFFAENMVAGRGFMAVAAVVFGNYSPVGVMLASLVFGAGEAVMFRLQAAGTNIPHNLLLMVPYILTVLVLCGAVGKNRSEGPAATGQPYSKE
ncbi:MAG: ABC transporter permease [Candidatus Hydrogenedentes bacterium]|nr:ABC transporter permease [Candidatus Hydrogenedentota bacterium]